MNKKELNDARSRFKHFFLKKVIFRLDYDGLLDTDVSKVVSNIRDKYYSYGLSNMNIKQENNINIKIDSDLNTPESERVALNGYNKNTVYCFESNNGEIIEIGRNFFSFCIKDVKQYKSFDDYKELLIETIIALNKTTQFFKMIRIGLRKINMCYLKNINSLNKYFTQSAFNFKQTVTDLPEYQCVNSKFTSFLIKDTYKINYNRATIDGVMEGKNGKNEPLNLIVTDIDVYKDDMIKISSELKNKKSIEKCLDNQNIIEFEVFQSSITDLMKSELSKDCFNNKEIRGVY